MSEPFIVVSELFTIFKKLDIVSHRLKRISSLLDKFLGGDDGNQYMPSLDHFQNIEAIECLLQ
jgi:hypothetical protein